MLRTAIRRGWLKDAPQADRDALMARFEAATAEREAAGHVSASAHARAVFAQARTIIEMDRENTDPLLRLLRYSWDGESTSQTTGRPRERWRVSDYPNRIDAAAIQRQWEREGVNPLTVPVVRIDAKGDGWERTDTVPVAAYPDRFRRLRLVLICPRCGARRMHLYPRRDGVACRACARIGYSTHGRNPPPTPPTGSVREL